MPMKYAWLLLFAGLTPIAVWADSTLPVGGVACLKLKDAKAYAEYNQIAPQFSADLIARASCYRVKDATPAVKSGRPEQGFQAYKLISGHRVWLPIQQ